MGKGTSSLWVLGVTEDAVIDAVGGHKRLKVWWDGWEEVATKVDTGRDGRCVGCRERSRGE